MNRCAAITVISTIWCGDTVVYELFLGVWNCLCRSITWRRQNSKIMHMCDLQAANHQKLKFATQSHGFIRNRPKCGHGSRETYTANVQRILIYKSYTGCTEGACLSSKTGLSLQLCPCCVQKWCHCCCCWCSLWGSLSCLWDSASAHRRSGRWSLSKEPQEQCSHPRQLFHVNQLAEELTVYFPWSC